MANRPVFLYVLPGKFPRRRTELLSEFSVKTADAAESALQGNVKDLQYSKGFCFARNRN